MALGGQIIRLLLQVVPVVMRAIPAAYQKAIQNAAKNGGAAAATSATDLFRNNSNNMSKEEALQILNFNETEFMMMNPTKTEPASSSSSSSSSSTTQQQQLLLDRFDKYMKMNEVKRIPNTSTNTGSFYLQSKIYHAKETLLRELQQQQAPPPPPPNASS